MNLSWPQTKQFLTADPYLVIFEFDIQIFDLFTLGVFNV